MRVSLLKCGTYEFPEFGKLEIKPIDIRNAMKSFCLADRNLPISYNFDLMSCGGSLGIVTTMWECPLSTYLDCKIELDSEISEFALKLIADGVLHVVPGITIDAETLRLKEILSVALTPNPLKPIEEYNMENIDADMEEVNADRK